MILFLTLVVIIAVGSTGAREGLLTSLTRLVNVVIAGLVAFNFFEPIADAIGKNNSMSGYEDGVCLFALFCAVLGLLRVITNNIANSELELPSLFQQIGSVAVSVLTGYLLAGFLLCLVQTLPVAQKFAGFDSTVEPQRPLGRGLMPPDRLWLAMMHRASAGPFSQAESTTFDPEGSFEVRYERYRRVKEQP